MDEEAAFLSAIRSQPDDPSARLVYADWLEDRGDMRAEYLRLQIELERLQSRNAELRQRFDADWLEAVNRWRVPLKLVLDDQREVDLRGLHVYDTYSGLLCGDRKQFCERYLTTQLPDMVTRVFSFAEAPLVLRPNSELLPAYTFIGWFESHNPPWVEPGNSLHMYLWLIVCWFDENLQSALPEIVHRAIRSIDWNGHARPAAY